MTNLHPLCPIRIPIRFVTSFSILLVLKFAAFGSEGPKIIRDIPYKPHGSTAYERERCQLDLYLPGGKTGFATLVWFHGGGLENGDKAGEIAASLANRFAGEGVAVASVNYRLSPKATFPAYLDDAAASFAWVYRHIKEHGGDPNNVFISGHSAGGYLTAMLGMDAAYLAKHDLEITSIAGLIPVSGQMITHSTVRGERGIPSERPVIDGAAPSFHVRAGTPPYLNVCGDKDFPARAAENIYFVAAMKAVGHQDVEYREFEDRNHGTIASRIHEANDPVAQAIHEFINRNER